MAKSKGKKKKDDSGGGGGGKKGSKGKKGKGKKQMTKQEMEAAKKRAEAEELERQKREAELAEKEERKAQIELVERGGQLVSSAACIQTFDRWVMGRIEKDKQLQEWRTFVACRNVPDFVQLSEVNAYLEYWRSELEKPSMKKLLKMAPELLQVVEELKEFLELPADCCPEDRIKALGLLYHDMMVYQQRYMDQCTYNILQDLSDFYDPEVGVFEYLLSIPQITHCLWGNMFQCPDYDGHHFQEVHFQFKIPEALIPVKGVYRLIKTEYDHYSTSCKSFFAPGIENALKRSIQDWIEVNDIKALHFELASPEDKRSIAVLDKSKSKTGKKKKGKKGKKDKKGGKGKKGKKGKKGGSESEYDDETRQLMKDIDDDERKRKKGEKKSKKGKKSKGKKGKRGKGGDSDEDDGKSRGGKGTRGASRKASPPGGWAGEAESHAEEDVIEDAEGEGGGKKGKKGKKKEKEHEVDEQPEEDPNQPPKETKEERRARRRKEAEDEDEKEFEFVPASGGGGGGEKKKKKERDEEGLVYDDSDTDMRKRKDSDSGSDEEKKPQNQAQATTGQDKGKGGAAAKGKVTKGKDKHKSEAAGGDDGGGGEGETEKRKSMAAGRKSVATVAPRSSAAVGRRSSAKMGGEKGDATGGGGDDDDSGEDGDKKKSRRRLMKKATATGSKIEPSGQGVGGEKKKAKGGSKAGKKSKSSGSRKKKGSKKKSKGKKKSKKKGKKSKKGSKKGKKGSKNKGSKGGKKGRGSSKSDADSDDEESEGGGKKGSKKGKKGVGKDGKGSKNKSGERGRSPGPKGAGKKDKKGKKGGGSKSSKSGGSSTSKSKSSGKSSKGKKGKNSKGKGKKDKKGKGKKSRSKSKKKGKKGKKGKSKSKERPKTEAELAKERERKEKAEFIPALHENELNLRMNNILGGTYNFQLLDVPPQPVNRGVWTIHLKEYDCSLKKIEFEADYNPPPPPDFSATKTPEEMEKEARAQEEELQKLLANSVADVNVPVVPDINNFGTSAKKDPEEEARLLAESQAQLIREYTELLENKLKDLIRIEIDIPKTALWFEPPIPVRWDPLQRYWSKDGFYDIKFDEASLHMSFRTDRFGVFGLGHNRWLNLPYQTWDLYPLGKNKVFFSLSASLALIEFVILEDQVCVTNIDNVSNGEEVKAAILNKFMRPHALIKALREMNLDLFPELDSYAYVDGILVKTLETEDHLYQCMALASAAFNFHWSRWNLPAGREKFVFQFRERHSATSSDNYQMCLTTPRKCMRIGCTEVSTSYNETPIEEFEYNADLLNMVRTVGTPEALSIISNTNPHHVEAVRRILAAIRPLSFA